LGVAGMSNLIVLCVVVQPNPKTFGGGQARPNSPNNTYLLKNSKDNAPWCYSVVHSVNIVCTIPAQYFSSYVDASQTQQY